MSSGDSFYAAVDTNISIPANDIGVMTYAEVLDDIGVDYDGATGVFTLPPGIWFVEIADFLTSAHAANLEHYVGGVWSIVEPYITGGILTAAVLGVGYGAFELANAVSFRVMVENFGSSSGSTNTDLATVFAEFLGPYKAPSRSGVSGLSLPDATTPVVVKPYLGPLKPSRKAIADRKRPNSACDSQLDKKIECRAAPVVDDTHDGVIVDRPLGMTIEERRNRLTAALAKLSAN